jgi:hypothetical protein
MEQFIGREVKFSAVPYHRGKMTIDKIEPMSDWGPDYYVVHGTTTEALERSRLGGHVSDKPWNGQQVKLYPVHLRELEAGELYYTYPV